MSPLPAVTRSGMIPASAPKISGMMKCPIVCRPAEGAGGIALRIEPTGAETEIGAVAPSLFGTVGVATHFIV